MRSLEYFHVVNDSTEVVDRAMLEEIAKVPVSYRTPERRVT